MRDMRRRPTHVNELVHQSIEDVGNMNVSGIGVRRAWMSVIGAYNNVVWRVEWPEEISNLAVSTTNPEGTIFNYDLEMEEILL